MLSLIGGCVPQSDPAAEGSVSWGRIGFDPGRFIKPRAMTVDPDDQLYIVDMTSRIQVFDTNGQLLRSWKTPECQQGKPVGLSWSQDNLLMVCDTHYFQVLFYTPEGRLLPERTIGGENGRGPGQFGFVTDIAQDSSGNYYVGEYGDYDRIQKFDSSGDYVLQWGNRGSEPGEFLRPQGLAIDQRDWLWVADASNHRLRVFDVSQANPTLIRIIGGPGTETGYFNYPFQLWIDEDNNWVWVCDMGNHRVQALNPDGVFVKSIGAPGRGPGEFHQPWSLVQDSRKNLYVLDTYNHRVQRFGASDAMGPD
jgi:DNA-binding beta-propeller fold protein YncE